MTTSEYVVTGMSCGHCEAAIRKEVERIPGVTSVAVSAASGKLIVESGTPLDDVAVVAAVDEAGYSAERA